ncbi:hypothetical protein BDZ94DRAFT_1252278 [Collybia nuda]|uniref:Uncharacterized protein n=1 Tax=Collybia nuda TaxID=64659 RepID=A0A9P5YEG7_9AGAR|nr:hypothetical protein BDZ94DRAFT_1252278 [Collybia nuda]
MRPILHAWRRVTAYAALLVMICEISIWMRGYIQFLAEATKELRDSSKCRSLSLPSIRHFYSVAMSRL